MMDGRYKKIKNIKPGQLLNENVRVLAVVRIKGDDLIRPRRMLYHLVTDTGFFKNKKYYTDYNFIIDKLFYIS